MRRALIVAAIAIAAVSLYVVTTAPAGQQAVTPKQFAALSKRVKTLEKDDKTLKTVLGAVVFCVLNKGAIPTTKAPAFHVTATGETTDFYALTTNDQDCVDLINSPATARRLRALLAH
jgi:hypothetical protein